MGNAIEAVSTIVNPRITVRIFETVKYVTISIEDNGQGISKENLVHVFEPFFSTKQRNLNFGLGLYYCYNVLQKQRGSIEVISKENEGTTIFVNFLKTKVVDNKDILVGDRKLNKSINC